jgi:hypothetical protein
MNRFGWEGNRRGPLAVLAAVFAVLTTGCGGQYGSVRFRADAGRALEAGAVLEGHRYYTTGSDTDPAAILALREDHPLRYGPWREVPMTPELLSRLVERMRGNRPVGPDGHIVLDAKGVPIGAWYSYFRPPIVKLLDDGGVEVSTPFTEDGDGSDAFKPGVR